MLDTVYGCDGDYTHAECSSGLTSDSFTFDGENYRVTAIIQLATTSGIIFSYGLDKAIPTAWILQADGRQLAVREATLSDSGTTATWDLPNRLWHRSHLGRQVAVGLSAEPPYR